MYERRRGGCFALHLLLRAPQALEQEKYSLQRKLECEQLAVLAAQQEAEGVRRRAEEENALKEQRQEQLHARRLHELTALNAELRAAVEELEVQVNVESIEKSGRVNDSQ